MIETNNKKLLDGSWMRLYNRRLANQLLVQLPLFEEQNERRRDLSDKIGPLCGDFPEHGPMEWYIPKGKEVQARFICFFCGD